MEKGVTEIKLRKEKKGRKYGEKRTEKKISRASQILSTWSPICPPSTLRRKY